jgi:hypothetical protein
MLLRQGHCDSASSYHFFKLSSDMSDSVKKKRLTHCPLFYRGFFISYMQGIKHLD